MAAHQQRRPDNLRANSGAESNRTALDRNHKHALPMAHKDGDETGASTCRADTVKGK